MAAPNSIASESPKLAHPAEQVRPFVRLKMAASLDGITALPDGRSQWITSPQARLDGHRWRARADAILTGIGTVLADDPRMDVRLPADESSPEGMRQPALCIVDTHLRTPPSALLFSAERSVHLFVAAGAPSDREAALRMKGAVIHRLAAPEATDVADRLDLNAVLATITREGIADRLHVEAGAQLSGSLLRGGTVDELLLYLAPSLLGTGRPLATIGPLASLTDCVALAWESVERVGPDLRIIAKLVRPK